MAVTVFAFISTALIPIPFLFVRFGPRLREASRHASEARLIIAHMHENSDSVAEGSKSECSLNALYAPDGIDWL